MLSRKDLELDGRIWDFRFHPLARRPDHLFRRITSNNGHAIPCQEERIFPGAAIDFQDMVAGFKGLGKHLPHSSALGAADHGTRKQVVIPGREAVKRLYGLILNLGEDCSCFHLRERREQPRPSLFDAMAKTGCAFGICRRCAGQAGKLHFFFKKPVRVPVKLL